MVDKVFIISCPVSIKPLGNFYLKQRESLQKPHSVSVWVAKRINFHNEEKSSKQQLKWYKDRLFLNIRFGKPDAKLMHK